MEGKAAGLVGGILFRDECESTVVKKKMDVAAESNQVAHIVDELAIRARCAQRVSGQSGIVSKGASMVKPLVADNGIYLFILFDMNHFSSAVGTRWDASMGHRCPEIRHVPSLAIAAVFPFKAKGLADWMTTSAQMEGRLSCGKRQ